MAEGCDAVLALSLDLVEIVQLVRLGQGGRSLHPADVFANDSTGRVVGRSSHGESCLPSVDIDLSPEGEAEGR